MAFHEIRFPASISLGASGGPERRTEIVALASGHEERNQRWADSKRRYDAGYGMRSVDDLHAVIAFFEERRGRFHGFRWKDWGDFKSCAPGSDHAPGDQPIGTGDGVQSVFQLKKVYGSGFAPWSRDILKPVAGTVLVALDGETIPESDMSIDHASGQISFVTPPPEGAEITAGFEFDVPARFDTDSLSINLRTFNHGDIPNIPIVEIRL